ncbi:type VII secretion protein EccB [Actinomadura yumaensis]|uniref:Type VII secretion protein EccB n=1 Tax=Actinomadura yumaensis TaxID=111807 RepID=A0ABW2CQF5_9ACTN
MQTRKDLYQAHRLMTQRVALALLQGKPGAAESPLRRTGVGALCGVMVVVLVAAGFGISGLLFKGGARNLEKPGTLLIEKESGATYAYSQGKLIPFLNYASARLAMSGTTIQRKLVSSKSLSKYPRGPLTGIQNAPESLPQTTAKPPWSLCTRNHTVSLTATRSVGGTPLTDAQAVLVQAGPQVWLVWRDTRMRITLRAARALTADSPTPVDERWLNGLPEGPNFQAPSIPSWGRPTKGPSGSPTPVGQLFNVPAIAGTPERWYVQLPDGLSAISKTQARLLLDNTGPGKDSPGQPVPITPAQAAGNASRTNLHSRDLPEDPPTTVPYAASTPLCAVYRATDKFSTEARFTLGGTLPAASSDRITLPGGGTFAGTLSVPGQRPQTFSLLTDQGIRYPIPTPEDVTKLGYSASRAAPVPASLFQLFKEGPALTAPAARTPLPTK